MTYKVGDKIIITTEPKGNWVREMDGMKGKTVTVKSVEKYPEGYRITEDNWFYNEYNVDHEATAKLHEGGIKQMKKSDLKSGMVVETRNGLFLIVMLDEELGDYSYSQGYSWVSLDNYGENLGEDTNGDPDWDIVKVYRPKHLFSLKNLEAGKMIKREFEELWSESTIKKMTVSEIEKELGYTVEIVKESFENE